MNRIRFISIAIIVVFFDANFSYAKGTNIEWITLHQEAEKLYEQKDYDRAVVKEEKALKVAEAKAKTGHSQLSVAKSLHSLAVSYTAKSDYAKAGSLFERSLKIFEKLYGRDHLEVAYILYTHAQFYQNKGEYLKAIESIERSQKIFERELGTDHQYTLLGLDNLIILYEKQGIYSKAESLINSFIIKLKNELGSDNPLLPTLQRKLVEVYHHQLDRLFVQRAALHLETALRRIGILKQALIEEEKELGATDLEVAHHLENLSIVYSSLRRTHQAEQLIKRSLAIKIHLFGISSMEVEETLLYLGDFYRVSDQHEKARSVDAMMECIKLINED